MKQFYIVIGLLFFCLSITSYAQISVFDVIEDAKKERGDATDAAEEDADAKSMEDMQEFFGETLGMKDTGDKPMVGRCLDLMGDHAYKLAELQDQIEKTKDCKKKKELLEYQALLLLSAGTKFFCPDEFNTDHIKYGKEISEYFRPLFEILRGLASDGGRDFVMEDGEIRDKIDEVFESNTSEELKELAKAFLKFKYADRKFGNPYEKELFTEYGLFLVFLYPDSQEITKRAWTELINYFNYFLSPEFMAKRSSEISSMRESLSCN